VLHTILYVAAGICVVLGIGMLFSPTYRTRKSIWLPLFIIGIGGLTTASALAAPFRGIITALAVIVALAGIFLSGLRPKKTA